MVVTVSSYKDLPNDVERTMIDEAERAFGSSYCLYSGFQVGACVLTSSGRMFIGANVENVAYGSCLCAERSAILHANAAGEGGNIIAVAVITKSRDGPTTQIIESAPCGACRQVIMEAARRSGKNIRIIMSTTGKEKVGVSTISDLLPLAFGPKLARQ